MTDNTSNTESTPVLSIKGTVATITLNRPGKRNRLQDEDLRALLAHFASINANRQIRVLVLTARVNLPKPVFCAGYNLGGFDEAAAQTPIEFETVPDALERLRPVTLCALNGSVYGGATDLALACDFRLGVEDLSLHMPAAALDLHFYASGLQRFVSRLGLAVNTPAQALEHEQSRAVGMVIDVPDGLGGSTRGLGSPITLNGKIDSPARSAAPRVGEHSSSVLREFGFAETEISELIERKVVQQG